MIKLKSLLTEANDIAKNFSVRQIRKHTQHYDDEDMMDDLITTTEYAILYKGKRVGYMKEESYFGEIDGELFGKDLPDLKNFAWSREMPRGVSHNATGIFMSWVRSKSGQKWLEKVKSKL